MDDQDFKIKISEQIAEIRSDVKHIMKNIPCAHHKDVESRIKMNRNLIMLLLTSLLGGTVFILQKVM
jgi:hypothetical protein